MLVLLIGIILSSWLYVDPPFAGTIFIDPDIITQDDPSTYEAITYVGKGQRTMYDRRVNDWVSLNAWLFEAAYEGGRLVEVQVNPEMDSLEAASQAERYAWYIGQLPNALRTELNTVWIHLGIEPFGGGNNNILIHCGQGELYIADGILEETLIHEASHTSLDGFYRDDPNWLQAQTEDMDFISTYAQSFPNREDIAESFLPYIAVRFRSDRISTELKSTIENTMPARIQFFDDQGFDMYPIIETQTSIDDMDIDGSQKALKLWTTSNPVRGPITLRLSGLQHDSAVLRIVDASGRVVFYRLISSELDETGFVSIPPINQQGLFFAHLNDGQRHTMVKIVVLP